MSVQDVLKTLKALQQNAGGLGTEELLELERLLTNEQGIIDDTLVAIETELTKRVPMNRR